jgi:flagellum-specific ATP synthase
LSGAALRSKKWVEALVQARERVARASDVVVEGTLSRMVGMTLEAVGCEAAVGGRCLVDTAEGKQIEAEVVGFSGDKLFLMPTGRCWWEMGCWGGFWTAPAARSTAWANCAAPTGWH